MPDGTGCTRLIHPALLVAVVGLAGCFGDTTGPGVNLVVRRLSVPADSVLVGAPGRPLAADLAFEAADATGEPVAGAAVTWVVADTSGRVEQAAELTDVRGRFGAAWVLGTRGFARQRLTVQVQAGSYLTAMTVDAVARPVEVSALAFTEESTTVRLGVAAPVAVEATDPFGNRFVPQRLAFTSLDTTVAVVDSAGAVLARRRGYLRVVATAAGVADTAWVHATQVVQSIALDQDTLRFRSIGQRESLTVTLVDDRGAPVRDSFPTATVTDTTVIALQSEGPLSVRSVGNGVATVRLQVGDVRDEVLVVVRQRTASLAFSIPWVGFDAVGDTSRPPLTMLDSLGVPIARALISYTSSDTTVATVDSAGLVTARGNGAAEVSARSRSGAATTLPIVVSQVPMSLTVAVGSGNAVMTLPVGTPLPLNCRALDANGVLIPRDAALVRSVTGTVSGATCGDLRVERSGYDTLTFALGSAQTSVPVIVATRPDSVGVVRSAQPLTEVERQRFVGEDLAHPSILALRPLVNEILAAYGNPTSDLDRARALRDWVARTAVHPHALLHPDGSTSNLGVLPLGTTWADVNTLYHRSYSDSMFDANNQYWWGVGYDGYAMLDRLLGTLDPSSGLRADDGMMVHVGGVRYQIRDLQTYRYPICSFQAIMLSTLWAAAGLHGMLISTVGHDPAAVFIPELGKWVYEDPTFNEEYLLDGTGDPLSPAEMLALSAVSGAGRLRAMKLLGPSFDPQVYVGSDSYMADGHPDGIAIMGSQLNGRVVGIGGWPSRQVQIDVPQLANYWPFSQPSAYPRVTPEVAFPLLGPVVADLYVEDSVFVIRLASTFPNHQRFERRLSGGAWESAGEVDVLPFGQCRVEYRGVDGVGSISATAVLDVWAPRAEGFVTSSPPGSVRAQARYCLTQPFLSP